MNLGKERKAEIFKTLAHTTTYETGLKFGFDKVYKDRKAISNAISKIYRDVKHDPVKFGVEIETAKVVEEAVSNRAVTKGRSVISQADREEIQKEDIKSIVTSVRNKSFLLLDAKLDMLAKSKKKLSQVPFQQLGTIAGIAFDKTRLLSGEATEHILQYSKIDKNMDPEEALNMVIAQRERLVENKETQ